MYIDAELNAAFTALATNPRAMASAKLLPQEIALTTRLFEDRIVQQQQAYEFDTNRFLDVFTPGEMGGLLDAEPDFFDLLCEKGKGTEDMDTVIADLTSLFGRLARRDQQSFPPRMRRLLGNGGVLLSELLIRSQAGYRDLCSAFRHLDTLPSAKHHMLTRDFLMVKSRVLQIVGVYGQVGFVCFIIMAQAINESTPPLSIVSFAFREASPGVINISAPVDFTGSGWARPVFLGVHIDAHENLGTMLTYCRGRGEGVSTNISVRNKETHKTFFGTVLQLDPGSVRTPVSATSSPVMSAGDNNTCCTVRKDYMLLLLENINQYHGHAVFPSARIEQLIKLLHTPEPRPLVKRVHRFQSEESQLLIDLFYGDGDGARTLEAGVCGFLVQNFVPSPKQTWTRDWKPLLTTGMQTMSNYDAATKRESVVVGGVQNGALHATLPFSFDESDRPVVYVCASLGGHVFMVLFTAEGMVSYGGYGNDGDVHIVCQEFMLTRDSNCILLDIGIMDRDMHTRFANIVRAGTGLKIDVDNLRDSRFVSIFRSNLRVPTKDTEEFSDVYSCSSLLTYIFPTVDCASIDGRVHSLHCGLADPRISFTVDNLRPIFALLKPLRNGFPADFVQHTWPRLRAMLVALRNPDAVTRHKRKASSRSADNDDDDERKPKRRAYGGGGHSRRRRWQSNAHIAKRTKTRTSRRR